MIGRRSRGIPAYNENAVLKLIIASGVAFVSYKMIWAVMMIADAEPGLFDRYFTANLALPHIEGFLYKFWTVLTYGWLHSGFWVLFSNMVWLYVFGSLVQMLIGHKQLIPIFIYCMIVGGLFYEIGQLIPNSYFTGGRTYMMGANASVTGVAVAALTLAPDYRYYLTDTLRIPLAVIAIIFFALQLINANINVEGAPLFLLVGGAVMGYGYVKLIKNGYKPADWIYNIFNSVERRFEPDERALRDKRNIKRGKIQSVYNPKPKQGITQNRIDEILDKINLKGYDSLTKEEREILMKAGQQKDS